VEPKLWSPLSEDFKPPTLLYRNEQLQELFNLCLHPIPGHVWCQGNKGLGKTLTARVFADEVETRENSKCYFFEWQSSLKRTLETINAKYNFKIPNYTLGASTIARKIIDETSKDDLVCIIIDEPQKAHFMRDVDNTAFQFYQAFLGKRRFSLIFLSQMRYAVARRYFSPDTLSRLQLKPIIFPSYTIPEIVEILKQRLTYMLEPDQYDTHALFTLAKHIRRIGSDIREALDILKVAIEQADDKINVKVMQEAIEWGKNRRLALETGDRDHIVKAGEQIDWSYELTVSSLS